MADTWRSVEIYLPSALSREEASHELFNGIIRFATDGGEFVQQIRIDACLEHPGGWRKWNTAYLVGPPTIFAGNPALTVLV
jgi:hypothetical protein